MLEPADVGQDTGLTRRNTASTREKDFFSDSKNEKEMQMEEELEEEERQKKRETVFTILFKELNPWTILTAWPMKTLRSTARTVEVLKTLRQTTVVDVVSGFINASLLFTFSAVFSSAIFGEIGLSDHIALGTSVNLVSVIIIQFGSSIFSDVGINIGGPDVNPTIFLASCAVR